MSALKCPAQGVAKSEIGFLSPCALSCRSMSYRNEDKHGSGGRKAKKPVFNIGHFRVFLSRHLPGFAVGAQVIKSKPQADPGVKQGKKGKASRAAKLKVRTNRVFPLCELRAFARRRARSKSGRCRVTGKRSTATSYVPVAASPPMGGASGATSIARAIRSWRQNSQASRLPSKSHSAGTAQTAPRSGPPWRRHPLGHAIPFQTPSLAGSTWTSSARSARNG